MKAFVGFREGVLRVSVAAVEFGPVIAGRVVPEGVPGPGMAAALDALDVSTLSDAELVEVMTAWRRVTSWAQSNELAAVAELVRRREEQHESAPAVKVGEFIADCDTRSHVVSELVEEVGVMPGT